MVAATELYERLNGWDLSPVAAHAGRHNPDWNEERLARTVTGYRHFVFLRGMHPKHTSSIRLVPHVDVDEIWHSHILHTVDYAAMCEHVLGVFMHHTPTPGGVPNAMDRNDYTQTRDMIRHYFGDDKDPEVWLGPMPL